MIVFIAWHVFSVCPPQAVLVDQANMEPHEKAAGTFVKMESGSENPHAHD